jgi:pSer/pThr/pTyr-binding forkhead associated (FHA) protein
MHQASFILVEDVRPPVGVLVFSDGSYQTIADRLIIGRDPSDDPSVRTKEAEGLALNDATSTLSRVHAEVRLAGWDVHIVDRGSTNGTFVWAPGQSGWERLAPNEARVLAPGMHVAFGRLSATFESSLRQKG